MKTMSRLLFAALLGLSVFAQAKDKNLTADLQALRQGGPVHDQRIIDRLRGYHVVFVAGFLSDTRMQPQWLLKNFISIGNHFREQMEWLTSEGIENHRVRLNSEAAPLTNAGLIALDLLKIKKPVILITHSKGGLDTLNLLVNWKNLRSKIAGWISLQTPFYGSPVADLVSTQSVLNVPFFGSMEWSGGTRESVLSMTTSHAWKYLSEHTAEIAEVVDQVPVLCLATWKPNVKQSYDTPLEFFRNWMEGNGILSDGMVPLNFAILPGSDYARLEGLDHGTIVSPRPYQPFDRVELTRELLTLLLRSIGET